LFCQGLTGCHVLLQFVLWLAQIFERNICEFCA